MSVENLLLQYLTTFDFAYDVARDVFRLECKERDIYSQSVKNIRSELIGNLLPIRLCLLNGSNHHYANKDTRSILSFMDGAVQKITKLLEESRTHSTIEDIV
jgi:predicted metalloprotease